MNEYETVVSNDNGIIRGEGGRLLPGTKALPGAGRKTRATEDAYLTAIKAALSPEQLTAALQTALELAIELRSPRAILAVVETVAAYGLGKPTQTIQTKQSPTSELLEQLLSGDFGNAPLLPEKREAAEEETVALRLK